MLEFKAIKCFAACVQTGSFSKAAEELFTTQSNVSKMIKTMETELGYALFERQSKGIRVTQEGERIYPYAVAALENIEKMQPHQIEEYKKTLSVSCNPSSWFADIFVKFYSLHREENLHYQVYSANSREVAERVRERKDDVGFAYVMKNQAAAFQYYLSRNYLEFEVLKETGIRAYPGARYEGKSDETDCVSLKDLKLIQRFPDEFSADNYWNLTDKNGTSISNADMVIATNSDYIMERILEISDLVNISGGYLSGEPWKKTSHGKELAETKAGVQFGCIRRKGEALPKAAAEFVDFLISNL